MTATQPILRETETFSATNFLRLQTLGADSAETNATLEHFIYAPGEGDVVGQWSCTTIVDSERMSRNDAEFIARRYAAENSVPVIYASHSTADSTTG